MATSSARSHDRRADRGGITFPMPRGENADGERPTTPTVKGVLADAARAVDARLAQRIEDSGSWRESYVGFVRGLTAASAVTTDAPVSIAQAGLVSAYDRMVHIEGSSEVPLTNWGFDDEVAAARGEFGTQVLHGTGAKLQELTIPYQGRALSGEPLKQQLAAWVRRGVIEESCAAAVERVIEHPEWLSLPGHVVADVGAGAEMGPLEMLARWGATVLAIDVPQVTDRLERMASAGAGEVRLPVDSPSATTGADIVANAAAVAAWIEQEAGPAHIVFGMHAYADSGMHIRLTMGADMIGERLRRTRPDTVLAYLATPTDAFVVPDHVVAGARDRWNRYGRRGFATRALRVLSRGRLFSEPYPHNSTVADCIVAQQGPNYAVAKRLQRWRALVAEADGHRVSFNVAPATLTRSVTKNTVLRAVYGGAHHFGVEVFEPETSRALMAALLVHDVMHSRGSEMSQEETASPATRRRPEELFSDNAAHGGLWRTAWAPRSALGVAAVLGAPGLLRRR